MSRGLNTERTVHVKVNGETFAGILVREGRKHSRVAIPKEDREKFNKVAGELPKLDKKGTVLVDAKTIVSK